MLKRQVVPMLACALLLLAAVGMPHRLLPTFHSEGTPQLSTADGCFYSVDGDSIARIETLACFTPAEVALLQQGGMTRAMSAKARHAVRPSHLWFSWAGWRSNLTSLG